MNFSLGQINVVLAWLWMTLGLVFGFLLGSYFHIEDWLGGYSSFRRRLYRLAHISFFGTAILNLLFHFTTDGLPATGSLVTTASWCFVVGAISMPACCFIMAHNPKLRAVFLIPVVSLILACTITLWQVLVS